MSLGDVIGDDFNPKSGELPTDKSKQVSPKDAQAGAVGKGAIEKARDDSTITSPKHVRYRSLSLPPLKSRLSNGEENEKGEKSITGSGKTYWESVQSERKEKEKAECEKRTANGIWECKVRHLNKLGGYIYVYRVKDEFNDMPLTIGEDQRKQEVILTKKYLELFPAVEPIASHLGFFQSFKGKEEEDAFVAKLLDRGWESTRSEVSKQIEARFGRGYSIQQKESDLANIKIKYYRIQKKIAENQLKVGRLMKLIGYGLDVSDKGTYLRVPDRDALRANWEKLKNDTERKIIEYNRKREAGELLSEPCETPLPPALDIISAEGVAGDMKFVESYFCHHALLSEGTEFLHDHFSHIYPAISLIVEGADSGKEYGMVRNRIIKSALVAYKRIWIAKKELENRKLVVTPDQLKLLEDHLEKAEAVLGSYVDTLTSYSQQELLPANYPFLLNSLYSDVSTLTPQWGDYMVKRFYPNELQREGSESQEVTTEEIMAELVAKFDNAMSQTWELLRAIETATRDAKAEAGDVKVMHRKINQHALKMSIKVIGDDSKSVDDLWAEVGKLRQLPLNFDDIVLLINGYYVIDKDKTNEPLQFRPFMLNFLAERIAEFPMPERFELTYKLLRRVDAEGYLVLHKKEAFITCLPLLLDCTPEQVVKIFGLCDRMDLRVFDEQPNGEIGLDHEALWNFFDLYTRWNSKESVKELLEAVIPNKDREMAQEIQTENLINKLVRIKKLKDPNGVLKSPGPALNAVLEEYYPDQMKALFP